MGMRTRRNGGPAGPHYWRFPEESRCLLVFFVTVHEKILDVQTRDTCVDRGRCSVSRNRGTHEDLGVSTRIRPGSIYDFRPFFFFFRFSFVIVFFGVLDAVLRSRRASV